jgi:hypothetical protein
MFCTTRGVYGYDYYTQFGTDGNQPDGKVGIPLYKTTTVNNTSAATSTITITDFTELNAGDKVNLVATDGTNYDFVQGDQSSVAGTFEATTSNNQTATNLMNVINTSSGPSGTRFTATVDGAVVTATQATGGTDGNTTVTLTDTGTAGMSKTNFTGGTANTYAVGTTEIAVDDFGSSMRDGSPLFTSSFEYLGNIASTLDVTNQWSVTLEAPGTLYTVEDGEQLYGYPQSGVDHWCQDIIDGVPELVMEELYLYEDAEWVVNSIKDYKDEYQEVRCSKVRGKRHSRRFAHG